ncbi:hypothetical protein GCM10025784_02550 [Citricoccus nitrophenolicus]
MGTQPTRYQQTQWTEGRLCEGPGGRSVLHLPAAPPDTANNLTVRFILDDAPTGAECQMRLD